ncbi:cytochrome oxidase small assembly protein [Bordetella sp. 2513F-2]
MTPEQRRRNRRAGFVLLAIVLAVFAWTLLRGAVLLSGMGAAP